MIICHLLWATPDSCSKSNHYVAANAFDAMQGEGVLTISSRCDGRNLLVEVSDTGVGIPPENIAKIFEPFFTTKEVGQGTGLGLAVCYGILTEHGGSLDVQSAPEAGTTFTITLPANELGAANAERATSSTDSDRRRRS